jgi:hypothetical protein
LGATGEKSIAGLALDSAAQPDEMVANRMAVGILAAAPIVRL